MENGEKKSMATDSRAVGSVALEHMRATFGTGSRDSERVQMVFDQKRVLHLGSDFTLLDAS